MKVYILNYILEITFKYMSNNKTTTSATAAHSIKFEIKSHIWIDFNF